ELLEIFRRSRPGASNERLYQYIATDYRVTSEVVRIAERKAAHGKAPVFVYRFDKETPVRRLGSVRSLEVPYVFDNLDVSEAITGADPDRHALAGKIGAAWTAFAREGAPHTRGVLPEWPAYTVDSRRLMILDDVCAVADDPQREARLAIEALRTAQRARA